METYLKLTFNNFYIDSFYNINFIFLIPKNFHFFFEEMTFLIITIDILTKKKIIEFYTEPKID